MVELFFKETFFKRHFIAFVGLKKLLIFGDPIFLKFYSTILDIN